MCLLLKLRRDSLCKSNVWGSICTLDVISEEGYSVFLELFIKRMSQMTQMTTAALYHSLAVVFVFLGQSMKK